MFLRKIYQPFFLFFLCFTTLSFQTTFAKDGDDDKRGSSTQYAEPTQKFNFDIDDNALYTDAKIYIENKKTGERRGIGTEEWSIVRHLVGKSGGYEDFEIPKDGLIEFGDQGPEGIMTFRNQLEKRLKEKGLEGLKGPSWNALMTALKMNPKSVSFITARMHSKRGLYEGFKFLHEKGLIPAMPEMDAFNAVLGPDFPEHLKGKDSSENKANVMIEQLDALQKTARSRNSRKVTNPDGTGEGQFHLWGFSDDDRVNFETARDTLAKLMKENPKRWSKIKITLFYTGRMRPDHVKEAVVITSSGGVRAVTPQEATRMPRQSSRLIDICHDPITRAGLN